MPTSSSDNAAMCGGFAICILICLYIIGLPMFVAGIVLITSFDYYGGINEAGIALVVISSIFIIAGIVTSAMAIYHCSKSGNTTGLWSNQGRVVYNQPVVVGQNPVYNTAQGVQPQYPQGAMIYTTPTSAGQAQVVQQQYPQQYPTQQYPPQQYPPQQYPPQQQPPEYQQSMQTEPTQSKNESTTY